MNIRFKTTCVACGMAIVALQPTAICAVTGKECASLKIADEPFRDFLSESRLDTSSYVTSASIAGTITTSERSAKIAGI